LHKGVVEEVLGLHLLALGTLGHIQDRFDFFRRHEGNFRENIKVLIVDRI